MGRRASATTGKTTLDLDPKLKQQAVIWAVRNGVTLKDMVEAGLKLVIKGAK